MKVSTFILSALLLLLTFYIVYLKCFTTITYKFVGEISQHDQELFTLMAKMTNE
jgi:uncharacterized membrane protein